MNNQGGIYLRNYSRDPYVPLPQGSALLAESLRDGGADINSREEFRNSQQGSLGMCVCVPCETGR